MEQNSPGAFWIAYVKQDRQRTWGMLVLMALQPLQAVLTPMLAAKVVGDLENKRKSLTSSLVVFGIVTAVFIALKRVYTLQQTTSLIGLQLFVVEEVIRSHPIQRGTASVAVSARNLSVNVGAFVEASQASSVIVVSMLAQSMYLLVSVDGWLGLCLLGISVTMGLSLGLLRLPSDGEAEKIGSSLYDQLEEMLLNWGMLDLNEELRRLRELAGNARSDMGSMARRCLYMTTLTSVVVIALALVFVVRLQRMTKTHASTHLVAGITIFLDVLQKIDEGLMMLTHLMMAQGNFAYSSKVLLPDTQPQAALSVDRPGEKLFVVGGTKALVGVDGTPLLLADSLLSRTVRENFSPDKEIPPEVLRFVDVDTVVGRRGNMLSWTQKRMVQVGRALLTSTSEQPVLIDKPYMGLSKDARGYMHQMIMSSPRTVIVALADWDSKEGYVKF